MAADRFQTEGFHIPLFQMSMTDLEGFHDMDVALLSIDSLNYLEDEDQVTQTFQGIYQSLKDGGQLIFDVHSVYKMDNLFLDGPFTYEDEEVAYIWHTEAGEQPHSVYHDLTFFLKMSNGLYERFEENQFQRTYTMGQYINWLKTVGFSEISVTADWTDDSPTDTSERIFFQAIK
jgi:hypothetical protein